MSVDFEAFFLPTDIGQRFCIFYPAQGTEARGQILYIHPLAEEMNKSRRMATLQARALSNAGFDVLQIDLLGCGDSSGDFGDATWQNWVGDAVLGCQWLREHHAAKRPESQAPPLWLWGLRAGCLLAVQAAGHLNEVCHFIFWQPAISGKTVLHQFLRIKWAADLQGGKSHGAVKAARQQLDVGHDIEVAGYRLSPELAFGIERSVLRPPSHPSSGLRVEWFELIQNKDGTISPTSCQIIDQYKEAGCLVRSHTVHGPAFWQTGETKVVPALISETVTSL